MKVKVLLLAMVLGLFMATGAFATTLSFDDIVVSAPAEINTPQVTNGYGDLQWDNFYVADATAYAGGSTGYYNGMVSRNNVAFNGYGHPSGFSAGSFDLASAWFSAAWNDELLIQVDGYLGGVLKQSLSTLVDTSGSTQVTFNWTGIDTVVFTSSGGTPNIDFSAYGSGTQFAMDDLEVSNVRAVPEPATVLGFGVPILMIGLGKLRGLRK